MNIREYRAVCCNPQGPEDDFLCICPCHDDRNGSLHVTDTSDRILVECMAGCAFYDILRAQGVRECQLWHDEAEGKRYLAERAEGRKTGKRGAKSPDSGEKAPKKGGKSAKKPALVREMFKVGGVYVNMRRGNRQEPITNIYDYQREDGTVVVRVARTELIGPDGKEKSFPVHHLGGDGRWYWGRGPYKNMLYRLPEVKAAIAEGAPVWVVEGEKDADNLHKLGFVATCNMGGGSKSESPAGKWPPALTASLLGADAVYLIPDNDYPGEGLMQYVAHELHGKVGTLKVLHLTDAMPDLAEKGDATDFCKQLRSARGSREALLELAERTRCWEPSDAPTALGRWQAQEPPKREKRASKQKAGGGGDSGGDDGGDGGGEIEDYYGLFSYCVRDGWLCRRNKDGGARCLCSFVPHPLRIVEHDDGANVTTDYVIGATIAGGRKLADTIVHGEDEFMAMRWPMRAWKFWGNITPSVSAREDIRQAIMLAGQKGAAMESIFGHTGLRKIGGRWAYLYNDGAIGAEATSVELPGLLKYYSLQPAENMTAQEAVAADLQLCLGFQPRIIYPLLAQAYLAPLYSILEAMEMPPSYIAYVNGVSNSFKSTLVSYIQAHFGAFYNRRFPATFQDTANSAREKAFYCKDALYTVDDYYPDPDKRKRSVMDGVANAVISAIADRAERGRLDSNQGIKSEKPARCTCIMTGEALPQLSESRVLRLYVIPVAENEIARSVSELEPYEVARTAGAYRMAMRDYVAHVVENADELPGLLSERMAELTREAGRRIQRREGRFFQCAAHLMLGVRMMLDQFTRHAVIDAASRAAMEETAWTAIVDNIQRMGTEIDASNPARLFVDTLRGLLAAKAVDVADLTQPAEQRIVPQVMIGYKDLEYYYFLPGQVHAAVRESLTRQGLDMPLSPLELRKRLVTEGLAEPDPRTKSPLRQKCIGRENTRKLWVPRAVIEGHRTVVEQAGLRFEQSDERTPFEEA